MSVVIGLPNLTFVGVAAALGVSHMALYKHVANIEALKCLVGKSSSAGKSPGLAGIVQKGCRPT